MLIIWIGLSVTLFVVITLFLFNCQTYLDGIDYFGSAVAAVVIALLLALLTDSIMGTEMDIEEYEYKRYAILPMKHIVDGSTYNIGIGQSGDLNVYHCRVNIDGRDTLLRFYSNFSKVVETKDDSKIIEYRTRIKDVFWRDRVFSFKPISKTVLYAPKSTIVQSFDIR